MTEPIEHEPETTALATVTDERMALASLEEAKLLLLVCASPEDAKAVRDRAEAVRVWAKAQRQLQVERLAAEMRVRAERRVGELLPENGYVPGPGRGHRRKVQHEGRPFSATQAHRLRQLASFPLERFEAALSELKQRGTVTTVGVLRILQHDPPRGMTREAHVYSLLLGVQNQLIPLVVRTSNDTAVRPDVREEVRRLLPAALALKNQLATRFRKERSS